METEVVCLRFWNCGDQAVVVAGVLNFYEGELKDWAAYIGIGPSQSGEEAVQIVAAEGYKLYSHEVEALCRNKRMDLYRD